MADDFDFSQIAPDKTAEITLFQEVRANCDEPIKLVVKHAGDGNPAFISARMKTAAAKDRTDSYERTARLYARHVVVGWKNVNKADGSTWAFSNADCEKLLLALLKAKRTDIVDYLVAFCINAENFHEPVQAAGELGKE